MEAVGGNTIEEFLGMARFEKKIREAPFRRVGSPMRDASPDEDFATGKKRLDFEGSVDAVHSGHTDVHKNEPRTQGPCFLDGFISVVGTDGVHAMEFENEGNGVADVVAVVDDENDGFAFFRH